MDKKDLERRFEAVEKQMIGLQDEIANLKEKLDEVQDEPEIPEFPTFYGGKSYYVDGEIVDILSNDSYGIEKDYNAFHTKSYAQEFARNCKLIAMILHCKWYLDRDYVPDWNNHNEEKFHALFNHDSHEFIACSYGSRYIDEGFVFFSTQENAQKCADWLNKHWKENENE